MILPSISPPDLPKVSHVGDAAVKGDEEVHVLVTGYGPFLEQFPVNASWSVASNLPSILPRTAEHPTKIHIHVHPDPIRVSWSAVSEITPKLHAQHYDIMLHMGLAAGRSYFTLERLAYRGRFGERPDVDGAFFPPEDARRMWNSLPTTLRPTFHCNDVWRRWRGLLVDSTLDVRPSDDPGNYLCGFIYYSSLAYLLLKEEKAERPIMFMHVPDLPTESDVERGVDVAVALIRALVESRNTFPRGIQKDEEGDVYDDLVNDDGKDVKMGEYPETWTVEQQLRLFRKDAN
ncbi:hypothetical protein FRB95_004103 [Tulasnella sp. JGI-2019a]|nr:hypothetical protein FRB95_004103 [Tulasnella sp. JGI-2019a]